MWLGFGLGIGLGSGIVGFGLGLGLALGPLSTVAGRSSIHFDDPQVICDVKIQVCRSSNATVNERVISGCAGY